MYRGEFSPVIAQLISKCLWSGWKWWWRVKEMPSPFLCSTAIRECSWKKTKIEKKKISRPYSTLSVNLLYLYNKETVSCIFCNFLCATIGTDMALYIFEFAFIKVVFIFILYIQTSSNHCYTDRKWVRRIYLSHSFFTLLVLLTSTRYPRQQCLYTMWCSVLHKEMYWLTTHG